MAVTVFEPPYRTLAGYTSACSGVSRPRSQGVMPGMGRRAAHSQGPSFKSVAHRANTRVSAPAGPQPVTDQELQSNRPVPKIKT